MKLAPLLATAGLVLWGARSDLLSAAIPMAVTLEGARYPGWRWDLGDRDFDRVVDLCSVLFVVAAIYLFSRDGAHGVFSLTEWLPLLLFPLILVQTYSSRGAVPAGALFLSLRRQRHIAESGAEQPLDLGHAYLVLCLLGAAMPSGDTGAFYWLAVAVMAWALSAIRPTYGRLAVWVPALVAVAGVGWAGHHGLRLGQNTMEEVILSWMDARLWNRADPYRSETAIGHIGRLKLSDRIVMHVTGLPAFADPMLLRQAVYQRYRFGTWTAPKDGFDTLPVSGQDGLWQLGPAGRADLRVGIGAFPRDGQLLLALPPGTWRLENLPVAQLARNRLGALRSQDSPGFVFFNARFDGVGQALDAPPEAADMDIPGTYLEAVRGQARALGLARTDPQRAGRLLQLFFRQSFRYTLYQEGGHAGRLPLLHFLTERRAGHCEYFASAGVLLLRAAGIPARYATGYALQEYSPLMGHHVVRRRHAHAWALYHDGEAWRDLDVTPPDWAAIEAEALVPWWQSAGDLVSRLNFAFQRWRWRDQGPQTWSLWLLPPLLAILFWRLARQQRVRRDGSGDGSRRAARRDVVQAETPFTGLYRRLAPHLGQRAAGETLAHWAATRILRSGEGEGQLHGELQALAELHYRLRFDPEGSDATVGDELGRRCDALARRLDVAPSGQDGRRP